MAKRKAKALVQLEERVATLETKLAGIDTGAAALADAITKEIRSVVEGEVDDLLSDMRIER